MSVKEQKVEVTSQIEDERLLQGSEVSQMELRPTMEMISPQIKQMTRTTTDSGGGGGFSPSQKQFVKRETTGILQNYEMVPIQKKDYQQVQQYDSYQQIVSPRKMPTRKQQQQHSQALHEKQKNATNNQSSNYNMQQQQHFSINVDALYGGGAGTNTTFGTSSISPTNKNNYHSNKIDRISNMSLKSGHPQTPNPNLSSKVKRQSQNNYMNEHFKVSNTIVVTSPGRSNNNNNLNKDYSKAIQTHVTSPVHSTHKNTLVPIHRELADQLVLSDGSMRRKRVKQQHSSIDDRITINKLASGGSKQSRASRVNDYSNLDSRKFKNIQRNQVASPKQSTMEDAVMKNKGLQRLLQQSMRQSESVKFRNFKQTDQAEAAYIQNPTYQNSTNVSSMTGYKQNPISSSTNMVFNSTKTFQLPELDQGMLVNTDINIPHLKFNQTITETMKNLVQNYQYKKSSPRGVFLPSASNINKGMESIVDRQPVDTTTSQTCSNGFFNENLDQQSSNKLHNQTRVSLKGGRYKDASQAKGNWGDGGKNSTYFPVALNKQSQMQFDSNVRVQNTSSGLQSKVGRRTQADFFSSLEYQSDKGLPQGAIEQDPKIDLMNNLKNSFESLDFVEQAKVMRIGMNESRVERFMGLYEANQSALHKRIQKQGLQAVSKSIDVSGRKIVNQVASTPHHLKNNSMEQNSILLKELASIPEFKRRKRQSHSKMSRNITQKLTSQTQPANFPAPDSKARQKIPTDTFTQLNSPQKIERTVPIRKEVPRKPYLPNSRQLLFGSDLGITDQQANKKHINSHNYSTQMMINNNSSKVMRDDITSSKQIGSSTLQLAVGEQQQQSSLTGKSCDSPGSKVVKRLQSTDDNNHIPVKRVTQTVEFIMQDLNNSESLGEDIGHILMNHKQNSNNQAASKQQNDQYELGLDGDLREDSDFQETHSSMTEDTEMIAMKRKRQNEIDLQSEQLSVTSQEKAIHETNVQRYMERTLNHTKQFTTEKALKNRSKVMVGKSQYNFPDMKVLAERSEKQALNDFEKETSRALGQGSEFGLAMMCNDKTENYKEEETPEEINNHVKFLTEELKVTIGGEQEIFKKDPLNKKPGLTFSFDELCELEMRLMADNANEFDKRLLYSQINKVANTTRAEEVYNNHPEYIYYMECARDTDTPLPILSHINQHTLTLANYTLSTGHCVALKKAAKYLQSQINRVRLDNCGVDDGEMAELLQAFVQFKDFKSIIYRQNDLQQESLECLKTLFTKGIPNHLQELRISNCHLTPNVTTELIEALAEKSFLKSLEIANAPLNEDSIISLSEYVMSSKQLEELDLSHNEMLPPDIELLFSYIKNNKKLKQLNISHNNLVEGNNGKNTDSVLSTEAKVIEYLTFFIKYDNKLVHLDLTSTNLSENVLLSILPAIKSTKGLQGLHLSGNPGVTENFKNQAVALLKTKPKHMATKLNINEVLDEETLNSLKKTFVRESVKIKQINHGKRIVQNGSCEDKFFDPETKLILMRILHQRDEIPGSGQWQIMTKKSEHCWLCDKEMKGFVFWCQGMEQKSKKAIQINFQEKLRIFNNFDQINAQEIIIPAQPKPKPKPEENKGRRSIKKVEIPDPLPSSRIDPVICGPFTSWKPRPMLRLQDMLLAKYPKEDKLDYRTVQAYLTSNYKWGQQHIEKFEDCQQSHFDAMDAYIEKTKQERFFDWETAIERQLSYKKPFFVNSDIVRRMKFEEVYIAPVYAKSGRNFFVVQSGDTHQTVELYKTIIDFRQEEVPGDGTFAKNSQVKVFKKPVSVFAKWKSDTEDIKQLCLDHDFDNWKLDKFELKDLKQSDGVKKVIYDNFFFLKAIFIEVACETSFPRMSQLGFGSVCQRTNLVDGVHLNIADVDRNFIAARTIEGEKMKDNSIYRFQFLEAIGRVAFKRFYDDGKGEAEDKTQAMQMCIDMLKKNWNTQNWEEWRWKFLYNVPVHETLNANITALRMLHKYCCKPTKKYPDLEDIQKMFATVDEGIGPAQVQYCFGMSKMTMILEREKKQSPSYFEIDFVEFLEMMGRAASAKFQGSELDQIELYLKVQYVLDDLFPLIDMVRKEREEDLELVESEDEKEESDDPY